MSRSFYDWYVDVQKCKMAHKIEHGHRLTNAEIAEALNYSTSYVAGIICGQSRGRGAMVEISKYLGIEPYDWT